MLCSGLTHLTFYRLPLSLFTRLLDEAGGRVAAHGGEGLGGAAVQGGSLPPGDGPPPLPMGGGQRPAGAAAQHLRHAKLWPDRPDHGERGGKNTVFQLVDADGDSI